MMQGGMASRLVALCFDANDPLRLARFWADALHWEIDDETPDEIGLVPTDDTRFRIEFQAVPEHKAGKNRIHLDLHEVQDPARNQRLKTGDDEKRPTRH